MVEPSEPSIGDPPPDEIATATASGHAFDPTDVRIYEFLIQDGGSITRNTMKYTR